MSKALMREVFDMLIVLPILSQVPAMRQQIVDYESPLNRQAVRIVIILDLLSTARHADARRGKVEIRIYDTQHGHGPATCVLQTHEASEGNITDDLYERIMGTAQEMVESYPSFRTSRLASSPVPAEPQYDDPMVLRVDPALYRIMANCNAMMIDCATRLSLLYVQSASEATQAALNLLQPSAIEMQALAWVRDGAPGWQEHARKLSAIFSVAQQQPNAISVPPPEQPDLAAIRERYIRCQAVHQAIAMLMAELHDPTLVPTTNITAEAPADLSGDFLLDKRT